MNNFLKLLRNEFFIAFLLLGAYMSTNAYIYGWDDQHLEIPILKHLIDPTLYQGDYYVETATKHFTSWLYPILAKLITIKQMPAAYLLLFLISRYFMFYWIFRLWRLISGSMVTAAVTTLAFFLLGRTDEFLYRSFCHEEFSFIFMFAGLYFFYRERYLLAAILLGICVNFHAIYGLFPMLYMLSYLLLFHPQRIKLIFQTGIAFVIVSLPFLLWQIPISISREIAHPIPVSQWMPLYKLSCFQNFIFGSATPYEVFSDLHLWWTTLAPYILLIGLYVFHLVFNPMVLRDRKLHSVIGLSWILLGVTYYFDYVNPHRFVVDLNLIRVAQYMRFFLMCYTTVWACHHIRHSKPLLAFAAAILVLACGTTDLIALFFLSLVTMVFILDEIYQQHQDNTKNLPRWMVLGFLLIFLMAVAWELKGSPKIVIYSGRDIYIVIPMLIVLWMLYKRNEQWLRWMLLVIPLVGTFIACAYAYHLYTVLSVTAPSGWQLQRNWVDMQLYVRDHTPKNALILTPYDTPMGGFRIHSNRKVLVCYRDCGIIGFDYAAAEEWNRRIHDIEPFKVVTQGRVDIAVMNAVVKYKVNYIVFMKYYGPQADTAIFKKIYQNEVFSLYQIKL